MMLHGLPHGFCLSNEFRLAGSQRFGILYGSVRPVYFLQVVICYHCDLDTHLFSSLGHDQSYAMTNMKDTPLWTETDAAGFTCMESSPLVEVVALKFDMAACASPILERHFTSCRAVDRRVSKYKEFRPCGRYMLSLFLIQHFVSLLSSSIPTIGTQFKCRRIESARTALQGSNACTPRNKSSECVSGISTPDPWISDSDIIR
jgi:hypothetical protein